MIVQFTSEMGSTVNSTCVQLKEFGSTYRLTYKTGLTQGRLNKVLAEPELS